MPAATKKRAKVEKSKKYNLSSDSLVKPWGNYLIDSTNGIREIRSTGLGLFRLFEDEFIHDMLLNYLIAPQTTDGCDESDEAPIEAAELKRRLKPLLCLSMTSKAFLILLSTDSFYRSITTSLLKSIPSFKSSWRDTLLSSLGLPVIQIPKEWYRGFYSDNLFAEYQFSSIPLGELCEVAFTPDGQIDVSKDNIAREENISREEFLTKYGRPNKPVIIKGIMDSWAAYSNPECKWTLERLLSRFGSRKFRAESVDTSLDSYAVYMNAFKYGHTEESPLYLFDKNILVSPDIKGDYSTPEYFNEDLFQVLGSKRPDHKWLIIGPERSGSTFHVDPNGSESYHVYLKSHFLASAWNAPIVGTKKWILFPPECLPPGVFVNQDQSEVTSPRSVAEWYLHYYPTVQKMLETEKDESKRPIVGVCRPGEIVFVPSGKLNLLFSTCAYLGRLVALCH